MAARTPIHSNRDVNWTTAVFTPWQIVAKYSLPVLVKVASKRPIARKNPEIDGNVFNLQKLVRVEQVTARVTIPSRGRKATRQSSSASEIPIVLNIPQGYRGSFQMVRDEESSVCLKGIEEILQKMPRYVKVLETATNIPKQALITLNEGDLMEINGTCKRATRDGIKDFLRCTANNRTMVMNPDWNGVYTVVEDDIMYSIPDLLKRFPLPATVKLAKLENHSRALLDRLPNNGKSCHLVLTTKTNTEFVLGIDEDHRMGLVMTESIDLNLRIPTWVSPSNTKDRQMSSENKFDCDLRLNQVICGYKEKLILFKPWRELFIDRAPDLPGRNKNLGIRSPQTNTEVIAGLQRGYYANKSGVLTRKTVEEINYISGPIIPQGSPKTPPRPTGTLQTRAKRKSLRPLGEDTSKLSRSCPDLADRGPFGIDLNLNLDSYGYLKLDSDNSVSNSEDEEDYAVPPSDSDTKTDSEYEEDYTVPPSDSDTKTDSEDEEDYAVPPSDSDTKTDSEDEEGYVVIPKDTDTKTDSRIQEPTMVCERPDYINVRDIPETNEEDQAHREQLTPEDKTLMKPHEIMIFEETQKQIRQRQSDFNSKKVHNLRHVNPPIISEDIKAMSTEAQPTSDSYCTQKERSYTDPRDRSYGKISRDIKVTQSCNYENTSIIYKSKKSKQMLPTSLKMQLTEGLDNQPIPIEESAGNYENINFPDVPEKQTQNFGSNIGTNADHKLSFTHQSSESDHLGDDLVPSEELSGNYENVTIPEIPPKQRQTYEIYTDSEDQSELPMPPQISITDQSDDRSIPLDESPGNYDHESLSDIKPPADTNMFAEFGSNEEQMIDPKEVGTPTSLSDNHPESSISTQLEESIYTEERKVCSATLRSSIQGTTHIKSSDGNDDKDIDADDDEYSDVMAEAISETNEGRDEPAEVGDVYEDVMIASPGKATDVTSDAYKSDSMADDTGLFEKQTLDFPAQKLPRKDELEHLSVQDVIRTLQSLHIPKSVQDNFRKQQVDGTLLKYMDENILQEEFGMKAFHAMKLKRFVDGWRPHFD